MNAPDVARDETRLAADAAADNLARDADVADLAAGLAHRAGGVFSAALMAHELALNHRLVMRFGAMADEFLDFTKPSVDPGERQVGRESVQYAAIAARLSERVRQAALAFRQVKASAAGRAKPVKPLKLCAACKKNHGKPARPMGRQPRDLAMAELAGIAGLAELARGAARGSGNDLAAILMAHELALNHRLVMRFGATAGRFLGHASATIDSDRRQVGRDSLRFAAIAARLSERVGRTARSLAELAAADGLGPDGRGKPYRGPLPQALGCDKCGIIFNAATGRFLFDYLEKGYRADQANPDPDGSDDGGPGDDGPRGGGAGGSSPPAGSSAPPAASGNGGQAMAAAAGHGVDRSDSTSNNKSALRRGRLNNNNPVGDYAKSSRCGARTRGGGCCRQPAMANGRCRLHGGKSTGPRTAQGLANSRVARRRHGRRTGAIIKLRSAATTHGRRLAHLTRLARDLARRQATGAEFQIDLISLIPAGHGLDRSDWPLSLGPAGFIRSENRLIPPSGERTGGGHGDVFSKG